MSQQKRKATTGGGGSSSSSSKKHKIDGDADFGPSFNGKTTNPETIAKLNSSKKLVLVQYDSTKTNQFPLNIPKCVWDNVVISCFDWKEIVMLRPTCMFFESYWRVLRASNIIRVPEDVPTCNDAMELIEILSGQKEYTKENPIVVVLSEAVHKVTGRPVRPVALLGRPIEITRNNITFRGQGKDKTTVDGGLRMVNKKNITLEELNVTHLGGDGLIVEGSESAVELLKCSFKKCRFRGLSIGYGATVSAIESDFEQSRLSNGVQIFGGAHEITGQIAKATFTNCTFHHNKECGVYAEEDSVVDLHGEDTSIHANNTNGLYALTNATINIHISSPENTFTDNLAVFDGAKIFQTLSPSSSELTIIRQAAAETDDGDEYW